MIVYVVTYEPPGWDTHLVVDAVFSSEEAAYDYIRKQRTRGYYDVNEFELDKPLRPVSHF